MECSIEEERFFPDMKGYFSNETGIPPRWKRERLNFGIKQVVEDQISTQHDLTSERRPTDIHVEMQVKLDKSEAFTMHNHEVYSYMGNITWVSSLILYKLFAPFEPMMEKQVFVDRCMRMQMSGPFVCTVMEILEVFQGCSQINVGKRNSLRLVVVSK